MTGNDERELLRATVAELVDKYASPAAVRAAMASERGYDEALWRRLCDQVGVAGLIVPEVYDGAGGSVADSAVVLRTLARGLVPTPLLGTVLAEAGLLAAQAASDETPSQADTLAALAAGTSIGAVAFDPKYVVHGDAADIVLAVRHGRLERWDGVSAEVHAAMDPTRRLAGLTATSVTPIGPDPGLTDLAAVLLAAEQIGAAERCLELTVAYTKERVQFGRPIGSFQALKHRMADLYVLVQSAQAVLDQALQADTWPGRTAAALARITASEAFSAVAAESVQMHGGVAITWEYDIQLYFKRAHGSAALLGPPRDYLRGLESEVL